jgi:nitrogen PTS system EIIA component
MIPVPARPESPTMSLATLIGADRVFFRLKATGKVALLSELGGRAAALLGIPAPEVVGSLAAREALGSTGIGAGIALPHARLPALGQAAGFFARLERPVDFDAIDGKPVDLVLLLLSPAQDDRGHLASLAAAARRLRDREVAAALRASPDAASLWAILVGPNGR